jgi:hypothetical protein
MLSSMFDVECQGHGCRVLLGPRAIERLANTPNGVVVYWRCFCGTRGRTRFGGGVDARPIREPALGSAA